MIRIKKPSDAPPPKRGGFVWKLFASFFFTGYSPIAPGTVGSLAAFAILWFIPNGNWIFWIALVAVSLFGVLVSGKAEKYWGKDPSRIVIDEVAGSMVSIMLVPKSIVLWLIAFLAFRAYDIFKLPPANTAEKRLPGGWGVMGDDIVAGIYAFLLVHIVNLLFPRLAEWTPWISS
ncbi:phosphatidylglycerophosphatase A [bacterium]|nr:phosphatidylglycerophosphatase A [bacterium]